jgi:hypothetical protein
VANVSPKIVAMTSSNLDKKTDRELSNPNAKKGGKDAEK